MPYFDDRDGIYDDFNQYCMDEEKNVGPSILKLIEKELIRLGIRKPAKK